MSAGLCATGLRLRDVCCDSSNVSACDAAAIHRSARPCLASRDVGCLLQPDRTRAAAILCYWHRTLQAGVVGCPTPPWTSAAAAKCVDDAIWYDAEKSKTTVSWARASILQSCTGIGAVDYRASQPSTVAVPRVRAEALAPHAQCPVRRGERLPEVWMALILHVEADWQGSRLRYWVAWHLALGASRILVYDNGSSNPELILSALRPFGSRAAYVWSPAIAGRLTPTTTRSGKPEAGGGISLWDASTSTSLRSPTATAVFPACSSRARPGRIAEGFASTRGQRRLTAPLESLAARRCRRSSTASAHSDQPAASSRALCGRRRTCGGRRRTRR